MASRSAAGSDLRPAGGDHSDHAPLASRRHMLVTAFTQDGSLVSAPVRVAAEGDRVYFRTWTRSAISKRLQRTDWVQVVPCSPLGLCRYGQPLDATARPLAGEEARRAAGLLAGEYRAVRTFLAKVLRRFGGAQLVHYEVRADEPPGTPSERPG